MTTINRMYSHLMESLGVKKASIPLTSVRFFRNNAEIPCPIYAHYPRDITFTSCQGAKMASLGDAILLTAENIGCIAAAISFGFVDQHQDTCMEGDRVYTDIMRKQTTSNVQFKPPSPKDFTDGIVYACQDSGHPEFGLFGENDSGRYQDLNTARRAISEMMAIQPPEMKGVFLYSEQFEDLDLIPDVVVLSVRPVELTRIVQAYQYKTGKRVIASMGGLRVVNSDLIVRPYLTQEINVSTYCLGARLIAQYEANRLGIGMPFRTFETIVDGMQKSKTGNPFSLYPSADE